MGTSAIFHAPLASGVILPIAVSLPSVGLKKNALYDPAFRLRIVAPLYEAGVNAITASPGICAANGFQ